MKRELAVVVVDENVDLQVEPMDTEGAWILTASPVFLAADQISVTVSRTDVKLLGHTLPAPRPLDCDAATARLHGGVLEVRVPWILSPPLARTASPRPRATSSRDYDEPFSGRGGVSA